MSKRRRVYIASWNDAVTGKRRQKRCKTLAEKRAVEARLREEARMIGLGLVSKRDVVLRRRAGQPILDAVTTYIEFVESRGRTAGHVKHQDRMIRRAIKGIGAESLDDLDEDRAELWFKALTGTVATRNHYRRALKAFTKWAEDSGWIASDPLRRVRMEVSGGVVNVRRGFTPYELARLVESSPHGTDYLLLAMTGLRWAEAEALTMRDVDLDERWVCVPKGIGKTDSGRDSYVPLARPVVAALVARRAALSSPLLGRRKPHSRAFGDEVDDAKVRRKTQDGTASPSSFRVTFTNWLTLSGADMESVMILRRDAGPIHHQAYHRGHQLLEKTTPVIDRMASWADRSRAKA